MFFYDEKGPKNRDTIVFLHGFLGSRLDWLPYLETLSDEFHCLAYDLPGHGLSPMSTKEDFLKALPTHVHLVGYSMGGRLAIERYLINPVAFKSLTLISTNPGEIEGKVNFEAYWNQQFNTLPIKESVTKWYQNPLFKNFSIPQRRYRQNKENLASALKEFSIVKSGPFWDAISEIDDEILWLFGENDTKYRTVMEKLKKSSPNHQYVIVEKACHCVHLDYFNICISNLRRFYANHSRRMARSENI